MIETDKARDASSVIVRTIHHFVRPRPPESLPTNRISGPYRLFFFSFDCNEPPHVHVERDEKRCKFWLLPVQLASNRGFTARELNRTQALVYENRALIEETWDEHCRHG